MVLGSYTGDELSSNEEIRSEQAPADDTPVTTPAAPPESPPATPAAETLEVLGRAMNAWSREDQPKRENADVVIGALRQARANVALLREVEETIEAGPDPTEGTDDHLRFLSSRLDDQLKQTRISAMAIREADRDLAPEKALEQLRDASAAISSTLSAYIARYRRAADETNHAAYRPIVKALNDVDERLEARRVVDDVSQARDDALEALADTRKAAGVTAETSLAQHFGDYAVRERRSANRLRLSTVALALLITGLASALLLVSSDVSAVDEPERLALTLPLAALAAYLGREASRHRNASTWAEEIRIRLLTLDAFAAPLSDEQRSQLRSEFGRGVFLTDRNVGTASGPSAVAELNEVLAKLPLPGSRDPNLRS